jgi:hypothetical protein
METKKPMVRTPLTAPDELDAILDGRVEPGDLHQKGEPEAPAVKAPGRPLPSAVVKIRCAGWREAEDRVEKLLEKDPDQVIEVYLDKSETPAYTASWPVENRKEKRR